MLPDIRNNEHLSPVPHIDECEADIDGFWDEFKAFHNQFADCFYRSESREHFREFMYGQLSSLARKSIEPIALALKTEMSGPCNGLSAMRNGTKKKYVPRITAWFGMSWEVRMVL